MHWRGLPGAVPAPATQWVISFGGRWRPNGVDIPWNPVNRRVKAWEGEVPAEPPHAGARCERLSAFLWSGRDRCGACGRDAAQQELRHGMVIQRPARIVFLKYRGHRGHRDFGRNPVNSAGWANGMVVKVRASLANVRCGRGCYRPIDIDRSPWDVFCDSFGQWGVMIAGGG